jgi:hypothetical protein
MSRYLFRISPVRSVRLISDRNIHPKQSTLFFLDPEAGLGRYSPRRFANHYGAG